MIDENYIDNYINCNNNYSFEGKLQRFYYATTKQLTKIIEKQKQSYIICDIIEHIVGDGRWNAMRLKEMWLDKTESDQTI